MRSKPIFAAKIEYTAAVEESNIGKQMDAKIIVIPIVFGLDVVRLWVESGIE